MKNIFFTKILLKDELIGVILLLDPLKGILAATVLKIIRFE